MYNVNNQVMNSPDYVYALRFVVDEDTTLHRFISGFNLQGSDYLGGRQGYADGGGGRIRARLVAVKSNGEPDLFNVLAQETVGAVQRYQDSKAAYGAPGLTELLYFNMGGVTLKAGQMYAMTYQNADSSPSANWFSENSPTVKESVAGPNGVNTLDAGAPGAIAGLDPREAIAWSQNGGQTWVWGRRAGEGSTPGSYGGSASSDDGTRLPWYGWQTSATSTPQSNQPYSAYTASGSYTLQLASVPRRTTLTEAGGYAPVGASVGVVTVRNTSTGQSAKTAALGTGLARGKLDTPVTVDVGQRYKISNSGTVLKAEGDSFIVSTFKVGTSPRAFQTVGQGQDVAQLFALPHPWFSPDGTVVSPRSSDSASRTILVLDQARLVRSAARAPGRNARRIGRIVVKGRVVGPRARRGLRVAIQTQHVGAWRTIGHTRVSARRRFALRLHVALRRSSKRLRVRATARGVRRSGPLRVALKS